MTNPHLTGTDMLLSNDTNDSFQRVVTGEKMSTIQKTPAGATAPERARFFVAATGLAFQRPDGRVTKVIAATAASAPPPPRVLKRG